MTNTFTALIERAMNTDSDNEAVACVRQAKKLYRGEPIITPRRVVRQQTTEVTTTDSAQKREIDAKIQIMQTEIDRARKIENSLGSENTALRTENLKLGQINTDLENENNKLKSQTKRLKRQTAIISGILICIMIGSLLI